MIKNLTIIATLITTVLLSGCDDGNDKAVNAVQNEVKSSLDDPESASFSKMKVVDFGSDSLIDLIVCGTVEGKDKTGKNFTTEFSSEVIKKTDSEFVIMIHPKYSFDSGLLEKSFYDYSIACTDGVDAFNKRLETKNKVD